MSRHPEYLHYLDSQQSTGQGFIFVKNNYEKILNVLNSNLCFDRLYAVTTDLHCSLPEKKSTLKYTELTQKGTLPIGGPRTLIHLFSKLPKLFPRECDDKN